MGEVFCKRKDQAVRPFYDIEFEKESGLIKSNYFDETPIIKLKGIIYKGVEFITRIHQWRVERRFNEAEKVKKIKQTESVCSLLLGVL